MDSFKPYDVFLLNFCMIIVSTAQQCSVQSNLALGKPASQSSTSYSGHASRAVDGNTNQNYWVNSCTHTIAASYMYWMVDLQDNYFIYRATIYNRLDCCTSRLRDFKVLTGVTSDNFTEKIYNIGTVGSTIEFEFDEVTARYLKIEKYDSTPLTLCEVQIFGTAVCKRRSRFHLVNDNIGTGLIISTAKVRSYIECSALCTLIATCKGVNIYHEESVVFCDLLSTSDVMTHARDTKVYVHVPMVT